MKIRHLEYKHGGRINKCLMQYLGSAGAWFDEHPLWRSMEMRGQALVPELETGL